MHYIRAIIKLIKELIDRVLKNYLKKYQVEFDAMLAIKSTMELGELNENKHTATGIDSLKRKLDKKQMSLIRLDSLIQTFQ